MSGSSSNQKMNLQKILTEYSEMKGNLLKLAELLKQEKKTNDNYIEKTQSLEVKNHSLEEENNSLKANYEFIQKRYDQLQKELSEAKKNSKGYSMLSYFTGSNIKEENNQLKEKIKMLESELEIKIKENEECHVEVFEYKKLYNDKISEFEEKEADYKRKIEQKTNELSILNEKTVSLANSKKEIETSLETANKLLDEQTKEFKRTTSVYEEKEKELKRTMEKKEKLLQNALCINEFKNEKYLGQNIEYLVNGIFRDSLLKNQIGFINSFVSLIQHGINDIAEPLIELIKERIGFYMIISADNKKLAYIYDKVKQHFMSLHQLFCSLNVFFSMFLKEMNNILSSKQTSKNITNLILHKNVILSLINKIIIVFEIVFRFFYEARNYYNYYNRLDEKFFITIKKIMSISKLILLKAEILLDYNKTFNEKRIQIIIDYGIRVKIKVDKNYFHNYEGVGFSYQNHPNFFFGIFDKNIIPLKQLFENLLNIYVSVNNNEIGNFIKFQDENKNKFNIKIVKAEDALKNGENILKNLKEIFKTITFISEMKEKFKEVFIFSYYNKNIFLFPLSQFVFKRLNGAYIHPVNTDEICYNDALENKEKLKQLVERENIYKEERIKNEKKFKEFDNKIQKLKNLLTNEQNANDILKLKLTDKSYTNESITNNSSETISVNLNSEFDEYIKSQKSLTDKEYSILSNDLIDGKEKFAFKIDNTHQSKEIDLDYHRKVNETMKRYLTKIKTFDLKVASNAKEKELKREYDTSIKEITNKYKSKEKELNEQISQKNDAIEGFVQQITYLSESMNDYETLKEKICNNCKKYIKKD